MYDLIVIGGGPGGYVAAIRAAQLGAKVALIEKEHLGGVCLNWGCIPTKSLLESASIYKKICNSSVFGIELNEGAEVTPKMEKIVSRSREIVKKLTSGVAHLMKKNKVTVYTGHGRIVKSESEHKVVTVDNQEQVVGKNIIIATGARNRAPNGIKVDGQMVWDCRHAMVSDSIPKSLVVIGAGAIGMEFASFFRTVGTEVTVIEYAPTILPFADHDIIKWATSAFSKQGIKFLLSTGVDSVETVNNKVVVKTKDSTIEADKCLVATGVTPNTEDIGLENVPKVKLDRGVIQVNDILATDEPGIFAIGDIVPGPWLAHKAMQEGIRCVEYIFSDAHPEPLHENYVPMCVYTMPQVAQIGLTEQKAKELGKEIIIGTYPLSANGKALTEGNDGIIKVILEKDTKIFLGAHMVGDHVTELIQGYSLLQYLEGLDLDVHRTVFPHPTLSEAVQEAVLAATGHAIHL